MPPAILPPIVKLASPVLHPRRTADSECGRWQSRFTLRSTRSDDIDGHVPVLLDHRDGRAFRAQYPTPLLGDAGGWIDLERHVDFPVSVIPAHHHIVPDAFGLRV